MVEDGLDRQVEKGGITNVPVCAWTQDLFVTLSAYEVKINNQPHITVYINNFLFIQRFTS